MNRLQLSEVVAELSRMHGRPARPVYRGPFEAIVYECAAYLVDDERLAKVLTAARLAAQLEPPLSKRVKGPLRDAVKVLKRFPGVGVPGAERLAMQFGGHRLLAPESNGLRVLTRLGFGEVSKDYGKTYRSVQQACAGELDGVRDLVAGHALLRLHGQVLCKASRPRCEACALAVRCPGRAQM